VNIGTACAPPGRRRFSVMKSNAAKEAGVAKNQSTFHLVKNKMIVLLWRKARRLNAQFSGHPEMNADPNAAGEFEEHLFSPRLGSEKTRTGQITDECLGVRSAKDALPRVELHARNFLPEPGIPLPAIIFDFGQLRHRG
jgi:hypothetical protein